ncbi:hypothetical protein [Dactylosporangium cerinum]
MHGQDVTGRETAGGQAGGDPLDPARELPVGDRAPGGGVEQRRLVAEARRVLQHEVVYGQAPDLHVGKRCIYGVDGGHDGSFASGSG